MIYTDLRGRQIWIKIGKNLPIGSTKCSLKFTEIHDTSLCQGKVEMKMCEKNQWGLSWQNSRLERKVWSHPLKTDHKITVDPMPKDSFIDSSQGKSSIGKTLT